ALLNRAPPPGAALVLYYSARLRRESEILAPGTRPPRGERHKGCIPRPFVVCGPLPPAGSLAGSPHDPHLPLAGRPEPAWTVGGVCPRRGVPATGWSAQPRRPDLPDALQRGPLCRPGHAARPLSGHGQFPRHRTVGEGGLPGIWSAGQQLAAENA